MLTRAFFALVFLLAACGPTRPPTPQERATVVIVKSDVVLGESGLELVTQPTCGGVAVGLVDTCHAPVPDNGTECLETGGTFVPVLP